MGSNDADTIAPETCPTTSGMPMLGLGTWENEDSQQCADSVRTALETGYRHIDTAQAYGNEDAVGEGLAAADVDRDEIFLATKIWISNLAHDDVLETARDSLDRLGVDYVDLLYVHWPSGEYDPEETLSAFSELYDEGLIENVGVSNFQPDHLETAVDVCDAPIFANQIEIHPMLQQAEIIEACDRHGVEVVGYSPLARGAVFDHPEIGEIAAKHDTSEAQVSLAWLREQDITTIPKATGADHIADNWESLTLELDAEDLETIDGIDETSRKVDPDFAPWD